MVSPINKDAETEGNGAPPRRYGRNIFFAVIFGLIINVLLGLFVDFSKFKTTLAQARAWEIVLPFASILLVYLIDSLRYLVIFRPFGIRISFRDALYNNVIGYFFCSVTPSSAGGQPFQAYHFSKLGIDSKISTNVIFSRLMVMNFAQLLVVLCFAHRGIALLATAGDGSYILAIGMVSSALVSLLLLFVFIKPTLIGRLALALEKSRLGRLIGRLAKDERWAEKLSAWSFGLRDSFRFLWTEKTWAVILDFLLFCLVQVVWSLGLYYPLRALSGVSLSYIDFLFAFIVSGLVAAYIPTPGASGSMEASYALVLGGLVGSFGPALSAVFLWRLGTYYLHLILGGLVYAFVKVPRSVYSVGRRGLVERRRR